jgi:hypothetical protein
MFAEPDNTPEYWQSLGRFVQKFSESEVRLNVLLWITVNTNRDWGRIIFNGAPIERVVEMLRKLFPLKYTGTTPERVEELERVLDQFSIIQRLRNMLLHNGTSFLPDGAVTKKAPARTMGGPTEEIRLSAEILQAMIADLNRINQYVMIHFDHMPKRVNSRCAAARDSLFEPWEYKPRKSAPAPAGHRRETP